MIALIAAATASAQPPADVAADDAKILAEHAEVNHLDEATRAKLAAIFAGSDRIGRGLPSITKHPMTEAQCEAQNAAAGVTWRDPQAEAICGGPFMRPLYDPRTQKPEDAKTA